MKKIYFSAIILSMLIWVNTSWAAVCDQTFQWTLRTGYNYPLSDLYTNVNSFRHNIAGGRVTIDETAVGDLNRWGGPRFSYTPELLAQDYEVAPWQSLTAFRSDSNYAVYDYPLSRANQLLVIYSLDVQWQNNDGSWTRPPVTHNECIYYTITRCGDGVIDAGDGETCDAGTANGTAGACNNTCNGTLPPDPVPVCNSIVNGRPVTTPMTIGQCDIGTASGFVAIGTNPTNYSWSCNAGTRSVACTANYTPPPVVWVCSTTLTGPQPTPVTAGLCNIGSPVGFSATGSTIVNYTWSCSGLNGGTSSPTCTASYVPPVVPTPPVCSLTLSGTQLAPVSSTGSLCATGTASGFVSSLTWSTTNYAWSCNNAWQSVACTANYTLPVGSTPFVSIKKYVKTLNAAGDTQTAPVSVARGEVFNYYYQLQNTGSVAATGVIVKDTLPSYLTFSWSIVVTSPTGTDVSADWSCTRGSQTFSGETVARITLVCNKLTPLPANSGLYTFTVPVVLASIAPVAVNMQNVVYACAANMVGNPTGPNGEVICDNVNPPPPPPIGQCDRTNPNSQKDPACIVVTGTGFDLQLKKYIGINDAQVGSPLSVSTAAALSYVIRVTNTGPESSSGVTTVQDILPTGVALDGVATGTGWTCSASGVTIRCTSSLVVSSGSSYPDITVPFRVTATAGQTVTNIAAVTNPLEVNPCNTDGSMPSTDSALCTRDPLNSDPAVLTVIGGGGGGASHVWPKCVNSVKSCALYNSIIACEAELWVGNCDSSDAPGQARCAAKTLICSGPGGPGGGGGGGWFVAGRCGDGVLQVGEECDVVGAPWCSVSCKINLSTNPGANPITDLWMTIPVLAGTQRLGYTWLDGTPGKVAFSDNRMVLGAGTKAFSLADTVGFGIRTQYRVPLMIEADRKICIKSEWASLNSQEICTTFGAHATSNQFWTRPIDGKKYVVLGQGDFQYQTTLAWPYSVENIANPNNVVLFKWATQYQTKFGNIGPTLNSAFFGKSTGTDGTIGLFTDTGIDLVRLDVRVSGVVVSSIGSVSNRAIETFLNTSPFADFLGTSVVMNTSTTSNNTNTTPTPVMTLPTLVGGTAGSATSVAELERYAVNGNRNILAVAGDLTIACPTGSTVFMMSGVRTVIVSGNLIIRCNVAYASSDTTSSWAWIAKGGDIQVSNGTSPLSAGAVTNLAGIYVTVAEAGRGGNYTYIPTTNNTTQAILRIDGSLYGNPKPLFDSRLYARATGAYDILTTGTTISYSNRALVSPPPLLSQYLGTYQVQRVVQ